MHKSNLVSMLLSLVLCLFDFESGTKAETFQVRNEFNNHNGGFIVELIYEIDNLASHLSVNSILYFKNK